VLGGATAAATGSPRETGCAAEALSTAPAAVGAAAAVVLAGVPVTPPAGAGSPTGCAPGAAPVVGLAADALAAAGEAAPPAWVPAAWTAPAPVLVVASAAAVVWPGDAPACCLAATEAWSVSGRPASRARPSVGAAGLASLRATGALTAWPAAPCATVPSSRRCSRLPRSVPGDRLW
jgi:hypothetical protein